MELLPCPYLGSDVELTDERAEHIAGRHPELMPAHRTRIAQTLADPDEVRRSARAGNARLLSRWFAPYAEGSMWWLLWSWMRGHGVRGS